MTTVLGVLGVLVVLFVAAAVALRDEAVLAEAPPDRADLALPDDGPVTAGDLARLRFGMALRGYRMAQVDAVLDRIARELLERDEQLAALSSEVDRLRARGLGEGPTAAFERPAAARPGPESGSESAVAAPVPDAARAPQPSTVALAELVTDAPARRTSSAAAARPEAQPAVAVDPDVAGQTAGVPLPPSQTVLETEPPIEHVPDSGEGAEPLPGVTVLPGADPAGPVPFPEPVHTDDPVRAPDQPDARWAGSRAVGPAGSRAVGPAGSVAAGSAAAVPLAPVPLAARPASAAPASARDVAVGAAARALHLARRLQSRLVDSRRSG